jgi:nucleoside-diphosphate-sugar epimerase
MRVFITGGTGFIGSAVVSELQAEGHDIAALARSEAAAQALERRGVGAVRGDVTDLTLLKTSALESDAVVHLAYDHDFSQFATAARAESEAVRAFGDALAGTGKALVIASGVHGVTPGRVATEQDRPGPEAASTPRSGTASATLALADRGVRSVVVRLAVSVHDDGRIKPGFAGRLVQIAARTGVAGYAGDGSARWSAVHRLDAARLFALTVADAPAGSVLHGVAEEGVTQLAIATLIGERLGLPVRAIPAEQAQSHFGFLAAVVAVDGPASSIATQKLLGWTPQQPELLDDLRDGVYFREIDR